MTGHDAFQRSGTHPMQDFCIPQALIADSLHFVFPRGEGPERQATFRQPSGSLGNAW